jgi:hypothetical protein
MVDFYQAENVMCRVNYVNLQEVTDCGRHKPIDDYDIDTENMNNLFDEDNKYHT